MGTLVHLLKKFQNSTIHLTKYEAKKKKNLYTMMTTTILMHDWIWDFSIYFFLLSSIFACLTRVILMGEHDLYILMLRLPTKNSSTTTKKKTHIQSFFPSLY